MKKLVGLVALLLTALLLSACGNDSTSNDDAGSGDTSSEAAFNDADVTFAQGMIPHHQQAVEMAQMAEDRAESPELKQLASEIEAAQAPEIEQLTSWLRAWGEPTEMPSMSGMDHSSTPGMSGSGMSGMMSDSDMRDLDQASAKDAGKLYLEQMIQHHEGAVEMAKTEVEKGENTDAVKLAKSTVSSQTEQIQQMQDMLASR